MKPGAVIELCIDWRSAALLLHAAGRAFGEMLNLVPFASWSTERQNVADCRPTAVGP